MPDEIRFGTDGWRAVIADAFTFDSVRLVADAIGVAARRLAAPEGVERNRLIVGYDRRFLSSDFAYEVALTLSKAGFDILLSDAPTPSQTVAWAVRERRVLGGVVVTASHNPAAYNGIKFKGWYGGSALPETYAAIASAIGERERRGGGSVTRDDFLSGYVEALRSFVDVDAIRSAKLRILHDPIHGAGAHLVSRVLGVGEHVTESEDAQMEVHSIRADHNPGFGGVNPEPIPENLELTSSVMRGRYDLAICNDGDADRLGVLDERGSFVSPHKILALLALYLVRERGITGEIVKTYSTTRLIERIASSLGVVMHETPIGFKYVADLMLKRDIAIGGEESGGIGIGRFLPERDGILSGLLVAECAAVQRRPLSRIVAAMEDEFGRLYYGRRDQRAPASSTEAFLGRVEGGELNEVFEMPFARREETDGVKLNFEDGSWILFRRSGTEPLVRIYAESPEREQVDLMLERAVAELEQS
jgi:phosphomannomutase